MAIVRAVLALEYEITDPGDSNYFGQLMEGLRERGAFLADEGNVRLITAYAAISDAADRVVAAVAPQ